MARGDLAGEISALRREPGGDIIAWGGANFVQALSRQGLVDEYRLVINPVASHFPGELFGVAPLGGMLCGDHLLGVRRGWLSGRGVAELAA